MGVVDVLITLLGRYGVDGGWHSLVKKGTSHSDHLGKQYTLHVSPLTHINRTGQCFYY